MQSGKSRGRLWRPLAFGERVVLRPFVARYVMAEGLVHHPLPLLLKTGVWGEDTSPYYSDSSLWPEGAMQGVRLCQELSADKWGQAAGASF